MEIVFGVLAAWGIITLAWMLAGAVLLPLGNRLPMAVVLGCGGEALWLERYVRGLIWLRDLGLLRWRVLLLLDQGLDPEGRELAQALSARYHQVELLGPEEWKKWMEGTENGRKQPDDSGHDCCGGLSK